VTHVFVSPHPDDAALSCGGLIATLRARGEPVALVTVFCGPGSLDRLTPYQRLALGFGSQARWQPGDTDAAADATVNGDTSADLEPLGSEAGPPTPAEAMAARRAEDEAYARFVGASVVFLNLPDAVFRGYRGDEQLLGEPRPDDPVPVQDLRGALGRLRPDSLYLPLAIGSHVDHRQARRASMALLAEHSSPYVDRAFFYEDFPYSLNTGFGRLEELDEGFLPGLPPGTALEPEFVQIGATIDRKLEGLRSYESQLGRLFGGDQPMTVAVREQATRVGRFAGAGPCERYWRLTTS
jgi:LmbE family N-acetylglucosaminyl deacetylase